MATAIARGRGNIERILRLSRYPILQEGADTSVSVPFLDAILFLMGIRRELVEAADAADPDFEQIPLMEVPGTPPV